jgi:MFS transporter, ACS family, tartrate transporter
MSCCASSQACDEIALALGMLFFVPQIIKQLNLSDMEVGWVTMIPYIRGAISMVTFGWLSDRIGDRRWSLFWTCVLAAVGLVVAGLGVGGWWDLAVLAAHPADDQSRPGIPAAGPVARAEGRAKGPGLARSRPFDR